MRCAFIAGHRPIFSIRAMCRGLSVQPIGFYAWLKSPLSRRAREDERQIALIEEGWRASGKVYGYRKIHDDLVDMGETCCPNRVARLAQPASIRAQIGYKRRPGRYGGKPSLVVDNAVAESFFNLIKRERIRRKVYRTRAEARLDVFDYIEMFYDPTRKHARNGMLSPVEFERQHQTQTEGV